MKKVLANLTAYLANIGASYNQPDDPSRNMTNTQLEAAQYLF